ncbi:MAG: hypothetical protein GEU79_11165 [Acidimicrobiia bacterium]|nr:hypothetical protein [Acidimicrobiia bacterium]
MCRLIFLVLILAMGLVSLPAAAQVDELPDEIDATVVDFGDATGVPNPVIEVGRDEASGNDVVAFTEAGGIRVGTVTEEGFEDWGADVPRGELTAVVTVSGEGVLLAITTPGPRAHLLLVEPNGSATDLISKNGYRTTDGGSFDDGTYGFILVSADGTADISWSYEPGAGVTEFEVAEPHTDVQDTAVEQVDDDGAYFVLYGTEDTRTLGPVGLAGPGLVEVPGAPVDIVTTHGHEGPGGAVVGTVTTSGDEPFVHLYRYQRQPGGFLDVDPEFETEPLNLGEASAVFALITLGEGSLLVGHSGGGADYLASIDLLDPNGNYLDGYVFPSDQELFVQGMTSNGAEVIMVGADPAVEGFEDYRAIFFAPFGRFLDDNGSVHEEDIDAIAERGITFGCNPPDNTLYCPEETVTREQMAGFLARAFDLEPTGDNPFEDTADSVFVEDIIAISEAGITIGCNPPDNTLYCPEDTVTRGQMAGFLARAFDLEPTGDNPFEDTADSVFVEDITAISEAGITIGCNPPDNTRYCPGDDVTRAEMASFLIRGLEDTG